MMEDGTYRRLQGAIVFAAVLLVLGLVLVGCSGGSERAQIPTEGETSTQGDHSTGTASEEEVEDLPEVASATSETDAPMLVSSVEQPEIEAFVETVTYDVDSMWSESFATARLPYSSARLQFVYDQPVESACGTVSESTGPGYCSEDQTLYYTVNALIPTEDQYGAADGRYQYIDEFGDFAVAFTVAHEIGHHVQEQLGILEAKENGELYTIQTELQADCLAGVWANTTYYDGQLEEGDIEEALTFAASIEDPPGTPAQDPHAHGTAEQRQEWFMVGYNSGDGTECMTY